MSTVFWDMLRRQRGAILGWGLSLALLGALLVSLYGAMAPQAAQLEGYLEAFPPAFLAAFGVEEAMDFLRPAGYLSSQFFSYMPLVLGILAVLLGSGLLVADEERGTLDLLMAQPISRRAMFLGRLLGMVATLAAVLGLAWLGLAIPAWLSDFEVGPAAMLLPILSLFAVLLLFATLALLLSFLLPARRLAAGLAGLLLVAAYFLQTIAQIDDRFEPLARLAPLAYYQSGDAVNGLNVAWFAALLALSALLALLALQRFERRDLRVGGKGSAPTLRRLRRA